MNLNKEYIAKIKIDLIVIGVIIKKIMQFKRYF